VLELRDALAAGEGAEGLECCRRPQAGDRRPPEGDEGLLSAPDELAKLRWHADGPWDADGRPVSDCTTLMPCKGAVWGSALALGDRQLLDCSSPFRDEGFAEHRPGPAGAQSAWICFIFAWLERLRACAPASSSTGAGATREDEGARYKAKIRSLHSGLSEANIPMKELATMGRDNLEALVDAVCEGTLASNELADILAGSMRFTYAAVCFLRGAVSAAVQQRIEESSAVLEQPGALTPQDLRSICRRHVEPLADTAHPEVHALVFDTLADELGLAVNVLGLRGGGGRLSFPLHHARGSRSAGGEINMGIDIGGGQSRCCVLYRDEGRAACPHFQRIRQWASRNALRLADRREPHRGARPRYPPRRGPQGSRGNTRAPGTAEHESTAVYSPAPEPLHGQGGR